MVRLHHSLRKRLVFLNKVILVGYKPLNRYQLIQDVAQLGSASVLGTEGHRFKSYHLDEE